MDPKSVAGDHLDLLRIDAVRAGEGTPEEESHVRSCERCGDALRELEAAAATLRRLEPPAPPIPPEVDERIMEGFRRRKVIPFPVRRRWLAPAAAAAAAVAALLVARPLLEERAARQELPAAVGRLAEEPGAQRAVAAKAARDQAEAAPAEGRANGDVNGDGKVDILDAYGLAVTLERGGAVAAAWDVDGDGAVTRSDVDALGRLAAPPR